MRRIRNFLFKSLFGKQNRSQALQAISTRQLIANTLIAGLLLLILWSITSITHIHFIFKPLPFMIGWMSWPFIKNLLFGLLSTSQKTLLKRSKTLTELAADINVDPTSLAEWVKNNHINPCFELKEETLYDENDFDTAKTLLRASSNPELTDCLLRPVSSPDSTPSFELLRPVEAEIVNAAR